MSDDGRATRPADPPCPQALAATDRLSGRRTARDRQHAAARAIRPLVLDRKNDRFAGADDRGQRAAAICGLMGTANMNGVDDD
jgi:hypothetical protein